MVQAVQPKPRISNAAPRIVESLSAFCMPSGTISAGIAVAAITESQLHPAVRRARWAFMVPIVGLSFELFTDDQQWASEQVSVPGGKREATGRG